MAGTGGTIYLGELSVFSWSSPRVHIGQHEDHSGQKTDKRTAHDGRKDFSLAGFSRVPCTTQLANRPDFNSPGALAFRVPARQAYATGAHEHISEKST